MIISVRKYLVVKLWNTNPASRHLQCGITLYSNIKTKHEFGNGTSGTGFMLYYYYHYYYYYYYIKGRLTSMKYFFCEMI